MGTLCVSHPKRPHHFTCHHTSCVAIVQANESWAVFPVFPASCSLCWWHASRIRHSTFDISKHAFLPDIQEWRYVKSKRMKYSKWEINIAKIIPAIDWEWEREWEYERSHQRTSQQVLHPAVELHIRTRQQRETEHYYPRISQQILYAVRGDDEIPSSVRDNKCAHRLGAEFAVCGSERESE